MRSCRLPAWQVALMLGYLLFYGVHFAECAYSLPRGLNPDCIGMVLAFFRQGLRFAPLRWLTAGPCQQWPHLNLLLFVPAVALLGLGYLGALRSIRSEPAAWPLGRLLRWSALAALPLLLLLPPTSADYLAYLFAGRVVSVYHLDPWRHGLGEFPAEFAYLAPNVWGLDLKCVYGPVWVAVMAAVTGAGRLLAPGDLTPLSFLLNVLLLRAANVAALLAAALAVWRINGRLWPGQQRLVTAAFLFNPLLVFESVGALHNDIWGVAFLLWACYFFLRDDLRFVLPLALAILTKYVLVAMLPLLAVYYARRRDWRSLGGLVGMVLLGLALARFTVTDYMTSRIGGSAEAFQVSPTSLPQFAMFLVASIRSAGYSTAFAGAASRVLSVLFGGFFLALLWRTRTREQVLLHTLWALTLYFAAVYLQTMQWYFLWPIGLLSAIRWSRAAANAALASTAVLLGYGMYFWNHNGMTPASQMIGFLLAIAVPALLCLAGHRGWWSACEISEPVAAPAAYQRPELRRRANARRPWEGEAPAEPRRR